MTAEGDIKSLRQFSLTNKNQPAIFLMSIMLYDDESIEKERGNGHEQIR